MILLRDFGIALNVGNIQSRIADSFNIALEGGFTTAVDRYPNGKSAYGCLDMVGNSWDWTSSEIIATALNAEKAFTPSAAAHGLPIKTPAAPINRGEGRRPQGRYSTVGFRLVAELK